MNISFVFALFGWRIGTFNIDITVKPDQVSAVEPLVDRGVKRISRRWVRHMAS